jgi:hypothetical protein
VHSELCTKICEREEVVSTVEKLDIFSVGAFNFTVVPWSIGTNEFMANGEVIRSILKERL